MGWCGGTEIFDTVVRELDKGSSRKQLLTALIDILEEKDWDVQNESVYWKNPEIRGIFKERNPEWFEE